MDPTRSAGLAILRDASILLPNPMSGLTDGGASVPVEQSGGGAVVWAAFDLPQYAESPQVSYLRMDGTRWNPPPFSTGVFRPPRA